MGSGSAKKIRSKLRHFLRLDVLPKGIRRLIIGVIGGTILLIGIALIVLPGPAFVVIPLGLAVLATEFAWARHYMVKARALFEKAKEKARMQRLAPSASVKVNVP